MELHFCSQCGISIPLAEVQSGAAKAGDGRFVCTEHRDGAGPLSKSVQAAGGAGTAGSEFELLFCANCQVSIPAADLQSGRAKREFGSLFCPMCSLADTSERDRRKKAVEAAMAADVPTLPPDTAETRRCGVCSAPVPQTQIDAGRAVVDGDRVVCPRCRDAGAVGRPRPAPAAGARGSSPYLVGALVVACLAAGFFGALYFKEYVKTQQTRGTPPAGQREVADLRAEVQRDLDTLRAVVAQGADEQRAAGKEAIALANARVTDELAALREDLTEIRSRLSATDSDLGQRVARLEGQIGGISEMVKGLAARPGGGESSHTGPTVPPGGGGGEVKPPGGPQAGDPPVAPGPPPVAQPDPVVTKLIKDLLESKEEGIRFTAAYELIRRKERSAIPAFTKVLIDDVNVMVRRAAARGLGELRAWNAVPALIQALEDKEAYVAQQANFALQSVTGQDFGVSIDHSIRDRKSKAAAASKWWEKNKDSPPDGVCLEPVTLKP